MLPGSLAMAQNKTTIQVFTHVTTWSIDKFSYTESLTNNRADLSSRHYPSLGIVVLRNNDHGYLGLGIKYDYMQSTFSYLIDSIIRTRSGSPYHSLANLSQTNIVERGKTGLLFQCFYRLNDHFGLKGLIDYSLLYNRDFLKSSKTNTVGFGRIFNDTSILQTEYDLLHVEKKLLHRFSIYLGGVYQPHPFLELSIGLDCQPFGSLIAERNVYLNDEPISQLRVYDRHLKINCGIAYNFIRGKSVSDRHQYTGLMAFL
jgi:lipopolysaccharide assembly outer membrane protein LptD (OstA)